MAIYKARAGALFSAGILLYVKKGEKKQKAKNTFQYSKKSINLEYSTALQHKQYPTTDHTSIYA